MTIKDRIKAALATSGLKKSELARRCGVTPGAVTQWLTGDTKSLKGETLLKIATALSVSPQWLSTGKGSISPPSDLEIDETQLVALFRELTEAHKHVAMSMLATLRMAQTDTPPSVASPFLATQKPTIHTDK